MANNSKISDIVYKLALPLAQSNGYTVYEAEYGKEGADYVLRVVLDTMTDDGEPVSIEACEAVSRALSEALDREDPIGGAYILEVTSPGLDRPLKKEEDFSRFAGHSIDIGLYKAVNGRKTVNGVLKGLEDGNIVLETSQGDEKIPLKETSYVRLAVEF